MYGAGIAALVAFCPNLLRLDLAFCPQLTDESVRAVGLYCPALLQLDLGSCFALSDLSLAYLSNGYATRSLHTQTRCTRVFARVESAAFASVHIRTLTCRCVCVAY